MSKFFPCPHLADNVELTEEREQHIIATHPGTLPDYEFQLALTLADPDQVRRRSRDANALLFSKWFDTIRTGRHLVVVTVSSGNPVRYWIITAYTARRITGGEPL
ncbi:MAG: hypothetical protein AAGC54_07755 [Cyanobacteria bacterium P01_F01_bin.4]